MNDLKAAIDTINLIIGRLLVAIATSPSNEKSRKRDSGYVDALKIALTALREKQQREKGCGWCLSGKATADAEAEYCPMCGRYLSGNAEQGEGGE